MLRTQLDLYALTASKNPPRIMDTAIAANSKAAIFEAITVPSLPITR